MLCAHTHTTHARTHTHTHTHKHTTDILLRAVYIHTTHVVFYLCRSLCPCCLFPPFSTALREEKKRVIKLGRSSLFQRVTILLYYTFTNSGKGTGNHLHKTSLQLNFPSSLLYVVMLPNGVMNTSSTSRL